MKENILNYIELWKSRGYSDGIPDEVPARLTQLNKAPSYKEICSVILKNDTCLKSLGYTPKKRKYYSDFKRVEIEQRENGKPKQLRLFQL